MIAAIYARKSSEQYGLNDEEKSIARQIAHSKAYASTTGWTVDERHIYADDGISGAEFVKRPDFLRLMNSLKPQRKRPESEWVRLESPELRIISEEVWDEVRFLRRESLTYRDYLAEISQKRGRC